MENNTSLKNGTIMPCRHTNLIKCKYLLNQLMDLFQEKQVPPQHLGGNFVMLNALGILIWYCNEIKN